MAQAGLTCVGNGTMALGAAAVAREYEQEPEDAADASAGPLQGFRDLGAAVAQPKERAFIASGLGVSLAAAVAIKYGSLLLDTPFDPSYGAALALVGLPAAAWAGRFALRAVVDP